MAGTIEWNMSSAYSPTSIYDRTVFFSVDPAFVTGLRATYLASNVPDRVTGHDRVPGHLPDDLQPRPAADIPPYLNNHNMKGPQTLPDRG